MFLLLVSMAGGSVSLSTDRTLWAKQRSTYWWDFIANETFSWADWMENFRMSRESLRRTQISDSCVATGYERGISDNRTFVWCAQIQRVHDRKQSVHIYCYV